MTTLQNNLQFKEKQIEELIFNIKKCQNEKESLNNNLKLSEDKLIIIQN